MDAWSIGQSDGVQEQQMTAQARWRCFRRVERRAEGQAEEVVLGQICCGQAAMDAPTGS